MHATPISAARAFKLSLPLGYRRGISKPVQRAFEPRAERMSAKGQPVHKTVGLRHSNFMAGNSHDLPELLRPENEEAVPSRDGGATASVAIDAEVVAIVDFDL